MSDQIKGLERMLGGKLERVDARVIPGTESTSTREAVYFSDDGKSKFRKQFKKITCFTEPPNATSGGINEAGCDITPPGGPLFHAVIYHGDLAGWRKDMEEGGKGLGLLLARVEGDKFVVSDGRSFPLSECTIEFT
ncbi:hypothetical protein [Pseudoxanthomonas composti]|uniref:Uncharacterized protein n=1 Tax=Pseudoxanthomonas composti TaxID=2137479 RepID=A0A4Q1JZX0_9GAMM|nr:hypothetical protein [Pseudoxanthomonas composti]RXR08659.1 hypothetical protein EPA99_02240 [Pseudoxanthomonas composti]